MEYRDYSKEELAWIKSLERVMAKAPNTLFMFVGGSNGTMVIYPKNEDNERYMNAEGAVDGNAPSTHISSKCEMDGGDW